MIRMANLGETTQSVVAKATLSHKPNLTDLDMASNDSLDDSAIAADDEMGEDEMSEVDSEIEDDMGQVVSKKRKASFSEDSSQGEHQQKAKNGVYKAPKLTSVAFDEGKDARKNKRDEREKERLGKTGLIADLQRELGDAPEQVFMGGAMQKGKVSKFEEEMEREEMAMFKRITLTNKEKKAIRTKQKAEMEDRLDNLDDDFAAINRIVKRTNAGNIEAINEDGLGNGEDLANSKFGKSLKKFVEKKQSQPEKRKKFSELNAKKIKGDSEYESTKQRQREKKVARKETEKQIKGRIDTEIESMGNSIQRNVNYDIMKAKGITRKRKKEDKNPRVKKRHQFEKLVKQHKVKVQEFADGKAQKLYQGEATGLRTGLKKSTKLN